MSLSTNLFKIFGRSPIKPLQKHMRKAHECAKALGDFFVKVSENDWVGAKLEQERIVILEHEADDLKNDIRSHLPKDLFIPVPREDVLNILTLQDKIPNQAKDIAGLVLGRLMELPEAIAPSYFQLIDLCIESTDLTQKAINELDELLETGFRDDEVTLVEDMIHRINEIEHEADEIQIVVRKALFTIENTLSPIDVIFLYKVIGWTGDISDRAEQVAHRLQLLLAH